MPFHPLVQYWLYFIYLFKAQLVREQRVGKDYVAVPSEPYQILSEHSIKTRSRTCKELSTTQGTSDCSSKPDEETISCANSHAKTEELAWQKNKNLKRQIKEMKHTLSMNKTLVERHLEVLSVLKFYRHLESADAYVKKSGG